MAVGGGQRVLGCESMRMPMECTSKTNFLLDRVLQMALSTNLRPLPISQTHPAASRSCLEH